LEMRVAGVHFAPGIEDPDDRFISKVLVIVTHAFEAGSMPKASQVIGAKPSLGTKLGGVFLKSHTAKAYRLVLKILSPASPNPGTMNF
jgi:hypothetical protein